MLATTILDLGYKAHGQSPNSRYRSAEFLEAFFDCFAAFFSFALNAGFFFASLLLFCSLLIFDTPTMVDIYKL